MQRLIDAEKLMQMIPTEEYNARMVIANAPTVDVVPKADYDHLLKRFKHLIQSDYIKSFDAWDSRKNDYVLDIKDAVEIVRCKDCIHREVQVDLVSRYEICGIRNEIINLNGFCDRGKRRENAKIN